MILRLIIRFVVFAAIYAVIIWLWAIHQGGHGAMGILAAGMSLAFGAIVAWCIAVAISRFVGAASARLMAHVLLTVVLFMMFSPVIILAFLGSKLSDLPEFVLFAAWLSPTVAAAALGDGTIGLWLGRGKAI
jgi:hypothetical protein